MHEKKLSTLERDSFFSLNPILTPAGFYEIGGQHGVRMMLENRPGWIARHMAAWFLEWKWRDIWDD